MDVKLLHALRAALDFNRQAYLPMTLRGRQVGWVRRDRAKRLLAWRDVFKVSEGEIQLLPAGEPALSAAFAQVSQALAGEGVVRGWRGETYAIRAEGGGEVLFHIERAAVRFFGLTSSAAHLNGYFLQNKISITWIARRAATKATDPGMLDNLVAGGVTAGEDAWQTLLRECGEEAGIPGELAQDARPAGALRICRDVPEGLNSEVLHAYDLPLPPGFRPHNEDGEVSEFQAMDARTLTERIAGGEFSVAAGLVAADFLLRHGQLQDEDGEIRAAIDACRVPIRP
jgi:8-oxo-dGTP pyrophosphatase MutT (NUDIX family)